MAPLKKRLSRVMMSWKNCVVINAFAHIPFRVEDTIFVINKVSEKFGLTS